MPADGGIYTQCSGGSQLLCVTAWEIGTIPMHALVHPCIHLRSNPILQMPEQLRQQGGFVGRTVLWLTGSKVRWFGKMGGIE